MLHSMRLIFHTAYRNQIRLIKYGCMILLEIHKIELEKIMKNVKVGLLLSGLLLSPLSLAGHHEKGHSNEQAMNNAARSVDVKMRDAGRKPAAVLDFYGIKPGMTVMEYGSGGGYYTEILSYAVGEKGKVYAQNSPRRSNDKLKALVNTLPNTEAVLVEGGDIDLPENSIDAAFIVLIFHHMHYNKSSPNTFPEGTVKILANIRKALKPGGTLAIIEHEAMEGTNRADSAALHRIDAKTTIADVTAQGFTFAGSSDVLQVKTDDRTKHFRQGGKRDSSWRLVQKYTKN